MKENTFCTKCGSQLKSHSKYCGSCGYEKRLIGVIKPGKKNEKVLCTQCKTEISPTWKYCGICGESITKKQIELPHSLKKIKSLNKPEIKNVQKNSVKSLMNLTDVAACRKEGMNFLHLAQYNEAIKEFDKILTRFPTDAEAFKWKCLAQERLDNKKTIQPLKNRESSNLELRSNGNKKEPNKLITISSSDNQADVTVQTYLLDILDIYGNSIVSDSKKVSALLSDYCKGQNRRERNALIRAIEEKIPQDLMKNQTIDVDVIILGNYQQRLITKWGMISELSEWVVDSWVFALRKKKN